MSSHKKSHAAAPPAPPAPLALGNTMPSLDGITWLKGSAPSPSKKLTLVELWATWCPPCVASIAHLTALAKALPDALDAVGLTDEEIGTARPFVEEQGEGMAYNVGAASEEAYARYGTDVDGIPHAFLFDADRRLVWAGHPTEVDRLVRGFASGALTSKKLGEIEKIREQINEVEASTPIEDFLELYAQRVALNTKIHDLDPSDNEALMSALDDAMLADLRAEFQALLARVEPSRFAAEQAALLALSLTTSSTLFMRAPKTARALLEHVGSASPAAADLRKCAGAYAALGDFSAATCALIDAVAKEEDEAELDQLRWDLDMVGELRDGLTSASAAPAS